MMRKKDLVQLAKSVTNCRSVQINQNRIELQISFLNPGAYNRCYFATNLNISRKLSGNY